MDLSPKVVAKFALMGAALVFVGHKLHVAVTEGWIRGRRITLTAADDPVSFEVYTLMYAAFAAVIAGMIVHGLWKAGR
jgi:hypothetical protein